MIAKIISSRPCSDFEIDVRGSPGSGYERTLPELDALHYSRPEITA